LGILEQLSNWWFLQMDQLYGISELSQQHIWYSDYVMDGGGTGINLLGYYNVRLKQHTFLLSIFISRLLHVLEIKTDSQKSVYIYTHRMQQESMEFIS
jgi:hypothetical protein